MEPDLLAWNVSHRLVDGADYHFDKSDEIGERPIAVGGVTFEREVGTVKLQQKAKQHVSDLLGEQGALAAGNERAYSLGEGTVRSHYDAAPARLLKIQPDLMRSKTAQLYPRWLWAKVADDWEPLARDWPKLRAALMIGRRVRYSPKMLT